MSVELVVMPPDERLGLPSASAMPRIAFCPGSKNAEAGLPPLPEEDTGREGSAIHDALHTGETDDLELTPKEIAERLETLYNAAVEIWTEYFGIVEVVERFSERRFWMRNNATLERVASAKIDKGIIGITSTGAKIGAVWDFKSGFKSPTHVEANWQIRTQCVAMFNEHPDLVSIRGGIAASRLTSFLDEVDYDRDTLVRSDAEIRQVIWRASLPEAPRNPGSWCRYCQARGTCIQSAVYASLHAQDMPVVARKDADKAAQSLAIAHYVGLMTPEQMGVVYPKKSVSDKIFEAIGDRLRALSAEELKRAGYEAKPGNRLKSITNAVAAWQIVFDLLGHEGALKCITIVRGRIAEEIAERESISLEKAKGRVDTALESVMEEKVGKTRLVKL